MQRAALNNRGGHHLEAGGTPIDELDGPLAFHGRYGRVHVLGHHVAAVQQAHGHVLALPRVALEISTKTIN